MKSKRILIADSCTGGLSILELISKWAGNNELLYLADYEKNPFGLKEKKEIVDIVESWLKCFTKEPYNIDVLVIACNTASIAVDSSILKLSRVYRIPIISMVTGMRLCLHQNERLLKNKNVAIMATRYSIFSKKYFNLVKKYNPNKLVNIVGTKCEHYVASGEYRKKYAKEEIKNELHPYSQDRSDTVILGCTNFKFLKKLIKEELGNNLTFLDPAESISRELKESMQIRHESQSKDIKIFTSGKIQLFEKIIDRAVVNIFHKKFDIIPIHLKR